MEIILISESKLKVMLSNEDLKSFELSTDVLDYGNTETKRMLWDVLGRAKQSTGFDTDGHRVLVQLYPCRDGSCELFITRLGKLPCNEHSEGTIMTVPTPSRPHTDGAAFGFDTMERLLAVCRRLAALPYRGQSAAYLGDDRRCYLFLSEADPSSYLPLDEYSFIGEYGTPENATVLRQRIDEHARPICEEGAVSCLSRF